MTKKNLWLLVFFSSYSYMYQHKKLLSSPFCEDLLKGVASLWKGPWVDDILQAKTLFEGLLKVLPHIDQSISHCSPRWALDRIHTAELSVLRTAVYAIFYHKCSFSRGLNLSNFLIKHFAAESSVAYCRGVLMCHKKEVFSQDHLASELKTPTEDKLSNQPLTHQQTTFFPWSTIKILGESSF